MAGARFYIGLSTSGHDPSFAVVDSDGRLLFAESSERYLQDKRAWGAAPDLPAHMLPVIHNLCGTAPEVTIATTWQHAKPELDAPPDSGHASLISEADARWLNALQRQAFSMAGAHLRNSLGLPRETVIRRFDHHLTHALAASLSCEAEDATCLVMDGEGDVGSVSVFDMTARRLSRRWRSWGPGSIGAYYGWATDMCGFDWRLGEEWKVMGLAALGKPDRAITSAMADLLQFDRGRPLPASAAALDAAEALITQHRRCRTDPDVEKFADLAASAQSAFGRMADQVLQAVQTEVGGPLILTGGCALNSAYNGTILRRFAFDSIHVPSAPADDGNAIGAALAAWLEDYPDRRLPVQTSPYLGSTSQSRSIEGMLRNFTGADITRVGTQSPQRVAELLAAGQIVGVMRDRAEFGPRSLGHRSILANPTDRGMKEKINARVKGREAYRPFAPVVLEEQAADWFHDAQPSPYMSFALQWRKAVRERVPAVVHDDGTGRLQTVSRDGAPWMHDLVSAFGALSGTAVVLNTSFNVMGKPIVHSVEDAIAVFATTGLDAVLIDDLLIRKRAQSENSA